MGEQREFPTLKTRRLALRELRFSDARAVFDLFSDPDVMRYYNHEPLRTLAEAKRTLRFMCDAFLQGNGIRWGIVLRGKRRVIGTCGFNAWHKPACYAEIGYDLARRHWNRGLMTEALRAMIAYGFEVMRLNRIEARVMPENTASACVLRKLGFSSEGVLRERGFWKGIHHDLEMFSLLKREWHLQPQRHT
jgi:ribosomal-protein-alanine N-acetyltransferase